MSQSNKIQQLNINLNRAMNAVDWRKAEQYLDLARQVLQQLENRVLSDYFSREEDLLEVIKISRLPVWESALQRVQCLKGVKAA
ncbi:MAG: hypothetical protein IT572_00660 [Deltaproteobacteria bacterium]|nr:hypothetical protein [Deltaproteobacteria bacterium]